MRLILREYLALLKEAGEIDALLPDLLLAMGIRPINRPGSGTRQFGVDVPAVGVDPESSPRQRKLFIVTAKQGDISRTDWNSGPDSVRQSLDDILDTYLHQSVAPEYAGLPAKIILATGGDMKQAVQASWDSYVHRYEGTTAHGHPVEFVFWGADALADLLQRYLVDEYLFPADYQAVMRRTLALVGEPDADLVPLENLVSRTLDALPTESSSSAKRRRVKTFRSLRLAVNTVFEWGRKEGNTRPALLAAEFTALRVWGFLSSHGHTHPGSLEFLEASALIEAWRTAADAYVGAIAPACRISDGLYGHSPAEAVEYSLRTYEVIGHLAVSGLDLLLRMNDASGAERAALPQHAAERSELLAEAIGNNPAAFHPPFDDNAIEVTLAVLFLMRTGRTSDAEAFVWSLATRIAAAQQMGTAGVPLFRANYDHLSDLALGLREPELPGSLLLLRLAELALVVESDDLYDHVYSTVARVFPQTHHQIWYPDGATESALYSGGGTNTGYSVAPVPLVPTASGARVAVANAEADDVAPYSADSKGLAILSFLASRRFRTPLRPGYWRAYIR